MEALKSNFAAKMIAMILAILCIVTSVASFVGIMLMDNFGVYQLDKEEIIKSQYEAVCWDYSLVALAGYKEDFHLQELSDTNFKYGVLKADSIHTDKMPALDDYLVRTFDQLPKTEDVNIYECDIGENTSFTYGENIWESFYTMEHQTDEYINVEYPIEGCYYDMYTEAFYLLSGKNLFKLEEGSIYTGFGNELALVELDNSFLEEHEVEEDGSMQVRYDWVEDYKDGFLDNGDGNFIEMQKIQIVDKVGLAKIGKVSDTIVVDTFDAQTIYARKWKKPKSSHYIVVSYVQQPLQGETSISKGDMFVQTKLLVDFVYHMRYPVIAILIVSLIGMIVAFSFLMAAAGHRKGQEEIYKNILDRLPLDLYLAVVFTAELMFAGAVNFGAEELNYLSHTNMSGIVTFGIISVCAGIAGLFLAILYCMSFAVHVKLGKWWRNTCIYWIFKNCLKIVFSSIRFFVHVIKGLCQSMTLMWKAWVVLGILTFLEFVTIIAPSYYYSSSFFYWGLEKVILYPLIILQLMQMNKLQKAAQRIANGELNYQIDTRHMFWEMKKHGDYLNDIGIGMNHAVNERLKSERFKTELITNVSHDIKTPLTSIINYVDLLQKEQIENPTVQEYLEVLHRQSARLKKLIEDLMEASKASTGSLNVVMEKCNAGVMLVQTVGEFEEKFMENQIELQVKKPEETILIEADNRHLWRVFDNLMTNICKYAQPMTRAYVNIEQDGQYAVITFRNISKYQLNISSEELMERFVRGDSSRNTEGSGLGISIAKSLTELMHGTFDLIVDGDLFKVVLLFPLYGTFSYQSEEGDSQNEAFTNEKKYTFEKVASNVHHTGARVVGVGRGVLDKTGQMFYRAGRFAQNVRHAAEQTKAEAAEERARQEEFHKKEEM